MTARQPKKHEKIYEDLRNRILSGVLSPGDRLPVERELAAELGVATMTLRRALDRLGDEGFLVRRPYYGTVVAAGNDGAAKENSFRVGLVVPTDLLALTHPVFSRLLSGVDGVVRQMGARIEFVVSNPVSAEAEELFLATIQRGDVDGWIIPARISKMVRDALCKTSSPKVLIHYSDEELSSHFFGVDVQSFGDQLSHHLLAGGYRKVALLSPQVVFDFREHFSGRLREELEKVGGSLSTQVLDGWGADAGARACRELLDCGAAFDAIVCEDDEIALGALQVLKARSVKIPETGLVGLGNFPAGVLVDPPLTTLSLPYFQVGKEVSRLLFDLLLDQSVEPAYRKFQAKLIVRSSTHQPKAL